MTLDQTDPRIAEAIEAHNRGDLKREAEILEPLLEEHPNDANLLQRVGAVASQLGELKKATEYLERALEVDPRNDKVISMLGWVYKRSGKGAEAQSKFEHLVSLDPGSAVPHMNLGEFHQANGNKAAARISYEKAVELDPDYVEALVSLADLCEREHQFEDAKSYAKRALGVAPDHGQANITLARVALREGHARDAAEKMQDLLSRATLSDFDIAGAFYLLGQAMESMGEYDHAFYTFALANDTFFKVFHATIDAMDSTLAPQYLDRINTFFRNENIDEWTPAAANKGPTPTFLVGFPRSGTTLLDQILSAHSAVNTLEEKENLIDVRNTILKSPEGLEQLRSMTDADVERFREMYWTRVCDGYDGDLSQGVFIDKMPLNTIFLGLIYRLFPDAKIIFALRDPRDVVMSCFQQRFGINVAMYQLTKTDLAASYYNQVMSIAETCRERLPLNVHVVRYEDVIADMKSAVSGALSFLGLEWEDQIASYRDAARERWITTPSAEQVIEPIYQSSMGKWRHYQRHLAPVLPTLEPWVEKFGYEPT